MSNASPADTVDAWAARDAELRQRIQGPGIGRPEQFASRTGLQALQAMLDGEIPYPPIARTLGFLLVEISAGRAVFQGKPLYDYYNPLNSVHGGWMATVLDSAVGCAIHSLLPPGVAYTTLELKLNFVKTLTDAVPLVRAIGNVIHSGSRTGTAEGRLVGPDGTLYAHASTTCMILDATRSR